MIPLPLLHAPFRHVRRHTSRFFFYVCVSNTHTHTYKHCVRPHGGFVTDGRRSGGPAAVATQSTVAPSPPQRGHSVRRLHSRRRVSRRKQHIPRKRSGLFSQVPWQRHCVFQCSNWVLLHARCTGFPYPWSRVRTHGMECPTVGAAVAASSTPFPATTAASLDSTGAASLLDERRVRQVVPMELRGHARRDLATVYATDTAASARGCNTATVRIVCPLRSHSAPNSRLYISFCYMHKCGWISRNTCQFP